MTRATRDLTFEQLEDSLQIDIHALEEVNRRNPELLYEVGKRLAALLSDRDQAKNDLKLVEAEVDAEIRHDAAVERVKLTEAMVASRVRTNNRVVEARDTLFDLEREYNKAEALLESFKARRYAIDNLVQLHLSNYYGSQMERSAGSFRSVNAALARKEHGQQAQQSRQARQR